jgi:hypothetical protein
LRTSSAAGYPKKMCTPPAAGAGLRRFRECAVRPFQRGEALEAARSRVDVQD